MAVDPKKQTQRWHQIRAEIAQLERGRDDLTRERMSTPSIQRRKAIDGLLVENERSITALVYEQIHEEDKVK